MPMLGEVTINGTYGQLFDETGKFLSNVQDVSCKLTLEKQEVRVIGQRQVSWKVKGSSIQGTLTQFKVTSDMLLKVGGPLLDGRAKQFVGELVVVLDDPESLGTERIRLKRVKFWEIDLMFKVNELITEAVPFTADGWEPLSTISGDPQRPSTKTG